MTTLNYRSAFYFVVGVVVGCSADHFLTKLLG